MIDMQTIGAGGGSIAYVDEGGAFRVGPRSAGADPGPGVLRPRRRRADDHRRPTSSSAGSTRSASSAAGCRSTPTRAHAAIGALAQRLGARPAEARRGRRRRSRTRTWRRRDPLAYRRARPRPARLQRSSPSAAPGPLHAAEVAEGLGIPEVLVPPYPGITSRRGPADERPALRPDAHGLRGRGRDRRRARWTAASTELAAELARALRARRRRRRGRRGRAGPRLPLRRPGLRAAGAPAGRARSTEACLEAFHRLHAREYGHAFRDPIEIVNAACHRPRAAPEGRPRAASRHGLRAADGRARRRSVCRVDDGSSRCSTPSPRPRGARRPASRSPGPRSCCSATRPCRPAGLGGRRRRRTASCSSPTPEDPLMSPRRTSTPITTAVIGGALDSVAVEMGHKLARMSYSSIIRESEDFGCAICDHEARQLCESTQSTPLQSGPIPGYVRGINRRFAELGEEWRPGDVVIHNHAVLRRVAPARRRVRHPVFHRRRARRVLGHDRAPPRSRRAHARHLRHRRRDRRVRRGPAVQRDQDRAGGPAQRVGLAHPARQHPRLPSSSSATWRRRWRRAGSAPSACSSSSSASGWRRCAPRARSSWTYSERMLRREIEALPDGTYRAERHARRLPRPPRPGLPRPADRGRRDGRGLATSTST